MRIHDLFHRRLKRKNFLIKSVKKALNQSINQQEIDINNKIKDITYSNNMEVFTYAQRLEQSQDKMNIDDEDICNTHRNNNNDNDNNNNNNNNNNMAIYDHNVSSITFGISFQEQQQEQQQQQQSSSGFIQNGSNQGNIFTQNSNQMECISKLNSQSNPASSQDFLNKNPNTTTGNGAIDTTASNSKKPTTATTTTINSGNENIICLFTPRISCYGSAECDQFKIDNSRFEIRRPLDITLHFPEKINIHSIACGGLHTLILSTQGKVYSMGCNDDGALGRDGTPEIPDLIDLDHPVDMISAGDSHSIACNSTNAMVYYWGVYRNTLKGNISQSQKPHLIGQKEFKRKKINKILSGANHSMVLSEGRLYAWGDSDTGVLGRIPSVRRKFEQGLRIESMAHGILDIYTGAYHAFLKKVYDKKTNRSTIYAWGLNNYGQLGTGDIKDTHIPKEIIEFRGLDIVDIVGGEHHTIALISDGKVYSFGKNDSGQLGLGEDYVQPEQKKQQQEAGKMQAESGLNISQNGQESNQGQNDGIGQAVAAEVVGNSNNMQVENGISEVNGANGLAGAISGDINQASEVELARMRERIQSTFKYVNKPTLISSLADANIQRIYAGTNYSYAITGKNEVYSWGSGDNYVLGTRQEDVVFDPELISKEFFKNENVYKMGLGSQHVVILTMAEGEKEPRFDEEVYKKIEDQVGKSAKKTGQSAKKVTKQEGKDLNEDMKEKKEKGNGKAIKQQHQVEEEAKISEKRSRTSNKKTIHKTNHGETNDNVVQKLEDKLNKTKLNDQLIIDVQRFHIAGTGVVNAEEEGIKSTSKTKKVPLSNRSEHVNVKLKKQNEGSDIKKRGSSKIKREIQSAKIENKSIMKRKGERRKAEDENEINVNPSGKKTKKNSK